MRYYRTDGGRWATSAAEAKQLAREDGSNRWSAIDVPTDKAGLLGFLTDLPMAPAIPVLPPAVLHDEPIAPAETPLTENGVLTAGASLAGTPAAELAGTAHRFGGDAANLAGLPATVALDQAFAAAPLAQRLTLAALALEEARAIAPPTGGTSL